MCSERSKKVIENILRLQYTENKELKTNIQRFQHLIKGIILYLKTSENQTEKISDFQNEYLHTLVTDPSDRQVLSNLKAYITSSQNTSYTGLETLLSTLIDQNKHTPKTDKSLQFVSVKKPKVIPKEDLNSLQSQHNELTFLKKAIDNCIQAFKEEVKKPVNLPTCIKFLENKLVNVTQQLDQTRKELQVFQKDNFTMHERISVEDTLRNILMPTLKTESRSSHGSRDETLLKELESYEKMLNLEKENNRILLDKIEELCEESGRLKLFKYKHSNNENVFGSSEDKDSVEYVPKLWEYGKWSEDIITAVEVLVNSIVTREVKSIPNDEVNIKEELNLYKQAIRCSICNENKKDSILAKCSHTFCKGCLQSNLRVRNRKCPTCKTVYDSNDIKVFYL